MVLIGNFQNNSIITYLRVGCCLDCCLDSQNEAELGVETKSRLAPAWLLLVYCCLELLPTIAVFDLFPPRHPTV